MNNYNYIISPRQEKQIERAEFLFALGIGLLLAVSLLAALKI